MERGAFVHVYRENGFKDGYFFYRWTRNEGHGRQRCLGDGKCVSWADVIPDDFIDLDDRRDTFCSLQPSLSSGFDKDDDVDYYGKVDADEDDQSQASVNSMMSKMKIESPDYEVEMDVTSRLVPLDQYNLRTLDLLHPPGWIDPRPEEKYNLIVIGGGCAGVTAAIDAAELGAKVALIEEGLIGGTHGVTGMAPTAALLNVAKGIDRISKDRLRNLGLDVEILGDILVDFPAIMRRLRRERAELAKEHGGAQFLASTHGFDLFVGRGKFCGKNTLQVNGQTLRFSKAIIATGTSPDIPQNVTKLYGQYKNNPQQSPAILTNENVFNLTQLPPRLLIWGVGSWAIEMAQAFARLGSQVTVISKAARILGMEDEDLATRIQIKLQEDGVDFYLGVANIDVVHREDMTHGSDELRYEEQGEEVHEGKTGNDEGSGIASNAFLHTITVQMQTFVEVETIHCDALLIATGRRPALSRLGLGKANVDHNRGGIIVDDNLCTSSFSIYAVGDICDTPFKQASTAKFMARLAVRNALFFPKTSKSFSSLVIPWTTRTDPGLAHAGLYEKDLVRRSVTYSTIERTFKDDNFGLGFVRFHVDETGKILGCSVLGSTAGELISEVTVAMEANMPLCELASLIHPSGTHSIALQACAVFYLRSHIPKKLRVVTRSLLRLSR